MVYYFTGNGNSQWVAEQIAEATKDKAINIAAYVKGEEKICDMISADKLGIVFPVHSWYAPRPVVRFLEKLKISADTYKYAVCTCGDDVGKGMRRLSKHFSLHAAWSVQMPNTYVRMFNLDSSAVAKLKINETSQHIIHIADCINNKRKQWDVFEGAFPRIKTYVINPLFVHYVIKTKGFHIEGRCTQCGKCKTVCPVGNIHLNGKYPVWGGNCTHCMACVHSCMEHIIQYGKSTQKRGRYSLREYL